MKEYIEKAVALEALSKSGVTCNMRAHKIVASIQAADVAEVRHGRWERHPQSTNADPVYVCSLCKLNISDFEKRWIKFCPNCGARMDKEDEHDKHPSDPV